LGRGRCYATPYSLPKPLVTAGTLGAMPLTNYLKWFIINMMEKNIVNDIRILNHSIIWVIFGLFLSICLSFIGINSFKVLLMVILPLLICSIPYLLTFFVNKKIKLHNNQVIISNAFFNIKSYYIHELKYIEILIINDLPIFSLPKSKKNIQWYGEISNKNIYKLLIYNLENKIIYNHNIQYIKNSKFVEELIKNKLGCNVNGKIELKLYINSLEIDKIIKFEDMEEANKYWMNIN
jgi:hypothetical protein